MIILLILTTFSIDYVLILLRENRLWSLLGLKGLTLFESFSPSVRKSDTVVCYCRETGYTCDVMWLAAQYLSLFQGLNIFVAEWNVLSKARVKCRT